MKQAGFDSPDEFVRLAIQTLDDQARGESYETLDAHTRAAIEEAEEQYQRGEALPWEQVREELRARFLTK